MKKALILISFILAAVASFSFKGKVGKLPTFSVVDTFVNKQTIASPTTLYVSRGGLRGDSALILPNVIFPDTTTANFSKAAGYNGSLIMVNANVYYRTLSPRKWNLIPASTSATVSWGGITGTLTNQSDLYDSLLNRVRFVDTASMLLPYLRKSDTLTMLLPYLRKTDTANMLTPYLRKTDTASMLSKLTLDRVLANGNTSGRDITINSAQINGNATIVGGILNRINNNIGLGTDFNYDTVGQPRTILKFFGNSTIRGAIQVVQVDGNGGNWLNPLYIDPDGVATFNYDTKGVTKTLSDNSTSFATTAFVKGQGYGTGSVTSVATNTGTGISGGTITTSGTLVIDTLNLSTRLWRQKAVDSLNTLISARVKYTDTASMLSNLVRKTGDVMTGNLSLGSNAFTAQDVSVIDNTLGLGVRFSQTNGATAQSNYSAVGLANRGTHYFKQIRGNGTGGIDVLHSDTTGIFYFDIGANLPAQTASRALVTDANKNVITSSTTATEIGYVSGVTSSIQTQINGLVATASNGLTKSSTDVKFGGTLTENTTITHNSNSMTFIQTKGMDNTGGQGIGGTFSMNALTTADGTQLNYSGVYGAIGNPSSSATTLRYNSIYSGVNGTSFAQNTGNFTGTAAYSAVSGWNLFQNSGNLAVSAALNAKTPAVVQGQSATGIVGVHAGVLIDSIRGATNLTNITNVYGVYQPSSLDTNYFGGLVRTNSGIRFGSGSTVLNYYEQGTFTATLGATTSGTITLSQNTLSYTRVGDRVTISGYLLVSSVSSPVGEVQLGGLPFTSNASAANIAAISIYAEGFDASIPAGTIQGFVNNSATTANMNLFASGVKNNLANYVKAGTLLFVSFTYKV